MCAVVLLFLLAPCGLSQVIQDEEQFFKENDRMANVIVEALQNRKFDSQLTLDLKKENQVHLNRTMSLLIKYIVKREVDYYRNRRADAISRKIYSALVMKLIDIARDLPSNQSARHRIDTAHRHYMSVESRDLHDEIADRQLFHCCARLYDILLTVSGVVHQKTIMDTVCTKTAERVPTSRLAARLPSNQSARHRIDTAHRHYMSVESRDLHDEIADRQLFHCCARLYDILLTAPRILSSLGSIDDLTPRVLMKKLQAIDVKPIHLSTLLVIQYHLRRTVNYAIQNNLLETLSAEPRMVGPNVIGTLKDLAAFLLPVVEMLDIHLAHSSPMFKDTCSSTWLGIVNNK